MENDFREKIRKNPRDPMNYYYLAKELMKRPLKEIYSVREIEGYLKKAIEIKPQLWAPKILLGELLFKLGRFSEAEPYFKESLKYLPNSESVRVYLTKCLSKKTEPDINKYSTESNQDYMYIFENNVREFLRILLEESFSEDWWRKGVPPKIRATCAARREEGLDEEKEADLLLFADFHDYRLIIETNKNIFANYIDTKEWCKKLSEMEPIRNAIAHNRPLTIAPVRVTEYSMSFSQVMEKIKGKNLRI